MGLGRIFYFLLIVISIGGILAPYLSVRTWPMLQFIPIGLVYLLPIHLLALLYFRKKAPILTWTGLAVMLLSIMVGNKDYKPGPSKALAEENFSVISYNVRNFSYDHKQVESTVRLLNKQQPDIICLQEFRNHTFPNGQKAENYLAEKLNMSYYRFVTLPIHIHGTAVFSRYPIVQIDTLFMSDTETNSGILMTIEMEDGKLGVANIHMSSYRLSATLNETKGWQERLDILPKQMASVLGNQQEQVDKVIQKTANYPYPLVITADLNSTPHTRITHQFTQYWQDSFRKKGNGIGWTYPINQILGMRIDYQFASAELDILKHEVIQEKISDHYPIKVNYKLKASSKE